MNPKCCPRRSTPTTPKHKSHRYFAARTGSGSRSRNIKRSGVKFKPLLSGGGVSEWFLWEGYITRRVRRTALLEKDCSSSQEVVCICGTVLLFLLNFKDDEISTWISLFFKKCLRRIL